MLGTILETNVFSELVKKYGRGNINFWRAKSGQEIDFILNLPSRLTAIEVKTNFQQFNGRAMESFCRKYKIPDWKVVGLNGDKTSKHFIFPWEI